MNSKHLMNISIVKDPMRYCLVFLILFTFSLSAKAKPLEYIAEENLPEYVFQIGRVIKRMEEKGKIEFKTRCSAVKISDKHFLTAAHCYTDEKTIITNPATDKYTFVKSFKVHEDYSNKADLSNGEKLLESLIYVATLPVADSVIDYTIPTDIAIIETNSAFDVSPVSLPHSNEEFESLIENSNGCYAYGFGGTQVSQPFPPVGRGFSVDFLWERKKAGDLSISALLLNEFLHIEESNNVILLGEDYTKPRDSGGPLICEKDKERGPVLVGICSSAIPFVNVTTSYTSVGPYLDWISEKIALPKKNYSQN